MLDASRKYRTHRQARQFGLPVAVLGLSVLAGAGLNKLGLPSVEALFSTPANARFASVELMAVEQVPTTTAARHPQATAVAAHQPVTIHTQAAMVKTENLELVENATTTAAPQRQEAAPVLPAVEHVAEAVVHGEPGQTTVQAAAVDEAVSSVVNEATVVDDRPRLAPGERLFNGRRIRPARTLTMVTTAYSPDERSCGINASGITASGKSVWTNGMKMVAADTRLLPFGTIVSIPGYYNGQPVPVLDRGGAIKGHRLDVLYPTHEIAVQWGRQRQTVTIWEYVD